MDTAHCDGSPSRKQKGMLTFPVSVHEPRTEGQFEPQIDEQGTAERPSTEYGRLPTRQARRLLAWIVAMLVSTGAAVCGSDGLLLEDDSQTAATAPAIGLHKSASPWSPLVSNRSDKWEGEKAG